MQLPVADNRRVRAFAGRLLRAHRRPLAAVVLLQHALDVEKSTGRPPGTPMPPAQEPA